MNSIAIISKLKTDKGVILAEVSFAMLLISIALLPISAMFPQAIQVDAMANDYTVVANLAQKQLELLKINPPQYWARLTLPCTIPWCDSTQVPAPQYHMTTTAVNTVDDLLVEVTVSACWKKGDKECKLEFVTLYPKW